MTKYIYAECPVDYWPIIKTFYAASYTDAEDKLIEKYSMELEDDEIEKIDNFKELRDYLNDKYSLALSDIEDIEEL